jgi:ribosomal protein S18 acetylase RimI-like enzyme
MYLDFRKEIDLYSYSLLKEWSGSDFIKIKDGETVVGFLMILDHSYVNGIYIKPEYRRKGLARKAELDYLDQGGVLSSLHVIKSNKPALSFWKSLFKLRIIDQCPTDILFEVVGLKDLKT